MKVRRPMLKSLAAVLAALLFAISVGPAFASDPVEPTIKAAVTLNGTSLQGLTAAGVLGVARGFTFSPVPVLADGRAFALDVNAALVLDTDRVVAEAMAAADGDALTPHYSISSPAVTNLTAWVAAQVDRKAVDSKRSIVKRRLRTSTAVPGVALDRATSAALLTTTLGTLLPWAPAATVTLPMTAVAPRVTQANIGKAIIVSLREFKVLLYNGARYEKGYRCAVGMRRFPTPVGTFKVIKKSAAPSWRNPYSVWSKKMPSVIRPGYNNPLGLRALYLNAPGIRIHGTSKTSSMGHAASHGCIRLTNKTVVDIYKRVPVGTVVYIVR